MKLFRLSPIWWCYYIIARFEAPYTKVPYAKQADKDYESGKKVRLHSQIFHRKKD